jgi:hypothetical protein
VGDLSCVEEEETECCENRDGSYVFDYKDVKRREPTSINYEKEWTHQKLFNENVLGSQIDNSQACFLPPSSEKLGVEGRRDFL